MPIAPHDVQDGMITKAIISMAKALSLTVVAEGVETTKQADFLHEQGCDQSQGYYFSKPVPADESRELLEAQPQFGLSVQPALSKQRAG